MTLCTLTVNPWFLAAEFANAKFCLCGGLFSYQCMRLEVLVVVANGWAESRWRLRRLCDLPRRFEMCYSAEDKGRRMFDDRLHECIIVIVGARGGREVDETGCEWPWWVSEQRSRRSRSVLLRHPPAHKMSANAA